MTTQKIKRFIILLIVFGLIGVVSICFINYNKQSSYEKATDLYNSNKFSEAKTILLDLQDYKNTKKLIYVIEIDEKIQLILKEDIDNFMYTEIFDPFSIDDIVENANKYEVLNDDKHKLIEYLKELISYLISKKYNSQSYEYAQYLIDIICNYTNVDDLIAKKQNNEVIELIKENIKNEKYSDIITNFDNIKEKTDEVKSLNQSYNELYYTYGEFLGDWGSSSGQGGFRFSILIDDSDQFYFDIKRGEATYDYYDLNVDNNTMHFMLKEGLLDPPKNVNCIAENGIVSINVDGREIHTAPIKQQVVKQNPQIGMTANEVKLSSWGNPNSVNKTTTENNIHEQWCYDNYKYIYFDNGVVTAIQE